MADYSKDPNFRKIQQGLQSGQVAMHDVQGWLTSNGYSPGDAEGLIHQAIGVNSVKQGAPADTFMGESGLQGMLGLADTLQNSGHVINPQDAWNVLKGMYQGQVAESKKSLSDAGASLAAGHPGDALWSALNAVPIVGHPIAHAISNSYQGNYGAMTGDLLALLGPKAAEAGVEALGQGARTAGLATYRSRLPLASGDLSPSDLLAAVKQGVDQEWPAQSFQDIGKVKAPNTINVFKSLATGKPLKDTRDTLTRIGRMDQPDTYLGELGDQLKPYVTGTNGAMPVSAQLEYDPVLSAIERHLDSPVQSGRDLASNMLNQIKPGLIDRSPIMKDVFDDHPVDPATGQPIPPLTTAQRVQMVRQWAKNNTSSTVAEAHTGKQDLYNLLSDSAYSTKTASAAPVGQRDAIKLLAAGKNNAINAVHPEAGPINNLIHNTINIKDALTKAANEDSSTFVFLRNLAVGAGALAAGGSAHALAGPGISETMGAGLIGALAVKAAASPRVATQLAIVMGKKFPALAEALRPVIQPVGYAGMTAAEGARSGNEQIQQLFNAPQQK